MTQKSAFNQQDVQAIRQSLARRQCERDTALFEVAISSALRGGDIVALRVGDVVDSLGKIKKAGHIRQEKTDRTVAFNLSDAARSAISPMIEGKARDAYVFEGRKVGQHVRYETFLRLIKWIASDVLGRAPEQFGCHSTRRSLAKHIYDQTRDVGRVAELLGHKDTAHTISYLGVGEADTLALARKYEL